MEISARIFDYHIFKLEDNLGGKTITLEIPACSSRPKDFLKKLHIFGKILVIIRALD